MIWADIIISLLYVFVFIGGLKEGAVKSFFSLISLIIAIPVTGLLFHLLAGLFSFLHNDVWANFLGFVITFAVISIILALIFLIPGKLIGVAWSKGVLASILGGVFSIIGFSITLVLFTILIDAYPIWNWLANVLTGSQIINWLLHALGFIRFMLPAAFSAAGIVY
jgi:uncharacterized membrane protein required for colicin V production